MIIYRLSYAYVFEGDTGVPSDSGVSFYAARMKDGTIFMGSSHYEIILRFYLRKNVDKIDSFGFLEADGTYTIKSRNPKEYMKQERYW
ncbi:MAG: hypothetical protein WC119_02470 [Synergistaceae bacterium]